MLRPRAVHAVLQCMVSKCGAQIFSCFADTGCRTALNCLNGCHFNDQARG